MANDATPADIAYPDWMTATATTRAGDELLLRPLQPADAPAFGAYLEALSDATRSFWGPHGFTHEAAGGICAGLADDPVLRIVATVSGDSIASYFLLHQGARQSDSERYAALGIPLEPATTAALAPSVADAWQNSGVGSLMMAHVLGIARRLGRTRVVLWDGVQARNARGVHFYAKAGFRKVGEFTNSVLNYDMVVELGDEG